MITELLFPLCLITTNSNAIQVYSDTLYLNNQHTCWIVKNNSSSAYYLHKHRKEYNLSNKISYKYGRKSLEQYLREMYYTEISPDCIALNVVYVLLFTPQRRLKDVYFVAISKFLDSHKFERKMKKWLSKKEMWIIENDKSDCYFFFGTLRII